MNALNMQLSSINHKNGTKTNTHNFNFYNRTKEFFRKP